MPQACCWHLSEVGAGRRQEPQDQELEAGVLVAAQLHLGDSRSLRNLHDSGQEENHVRS